MIIEPNWNTRQRICDKCKKEFKIQNRGKRKVYCLNGPEAREILGNEENEILFFSVGESGYIIVYREHTPPEEEKGWTEPTS